jgi:periplasmic divalent cation tolerance protein
MILYSPFPTEEAAADAAKTLLEQRLIACANILSGAMSLYHWEGRIADTREAILLAKTLPEQSPHAARALKSLHPYDIPAIITLSDASILPDYAAWVDKELLAKSCESEDSLI